MAYLSAEEYTLYGLDDATPESLVLAASDMVDAHCRRKGFDTAQYTERFRIGKSSAVRLSYLPLVAAEGTDSPILKVRGRYGATTTEWSGVMDLTSEIAQAFVLPATWMDIAPGLVDVDCATGEVLFRGGLLSLTLTEVEVTYTAGYAEVPRAVKQACAKLVHNALSTPALNVKKTRVDRMYLEYFSDTLLDADVKRLLAPYVSQRLS